jgi:hypothetical protein
VSPEELQSFFLVALGFAFAGSLAEGYQLVTAQPARFELLTERARADAILTVPFLVFAAPFIIMRNTVRGRVIERRRFEFVMLATVVAGIWSLLSGTVVVMALSALRQILA